MDYCAENAIEFAPAVCGQWFVSETRCGPMVHAKLGIAAENSGKLVTQVRRTAQEVAHRHGLELILCDGSPGIGCPVIASLTGASLALFVVEPTVSGVHDFRRVAQLAARLDVPGLLAVNKADLNEDIAKELEAMADAARDSPGGTNSLRPRSNPRTDCPQDRGGSVRWPGGSRRYGRSGPSIQKQSIVVSPLRQSSGLVQIQS